jgi:hypothetical protein
VQKRSDFEPREIIVFEFFKVPGGDTADFRTAESNIETTLKITALDPNVRNTPTSILARRF